MRRRYHSSVVAVQKWLSVRVEIRVLVRSWGQVDVDGGGGCIK